MPKAQSWMSLNNLISVLNSALLSVHWGLSICIFPWPFPLTSDLNIQFPILHLHLDVFLRCCTVKIAKTQAPILLAHSLLLPRSSPLQLMVIPSFCSEAYSHLWSPYFSHASREFDQQILCAITSNNIPTPATSHSLRDYYPSSSRERWCLYFSLFHLQALLCKAHKPWHTLPVDIQRNNWNPSHHGLQALLCSHCHHFL